MLDIKFIRDNKDLVALAARKKRSDFKVEELISADDKRRSLMQSSEKKRAEQNAANEKISKAANPEERTKLINDMKTVKSDLEKDETALKEVMKDWQSLMLRVPNIPDMSVPDGESDADNKEIKTWGDKPKFSFEPKNHVDIMLALDIADFERGSKVHGFRGYFLKGDAVALCLAIWQHALNFFNSRGYNPVIPPIINRKLCLLGTGYLPGGEDDLYKTQDGDYLAGTAEVPLMGMYSDEILPAAELPKKMLGFSPCYRREAGAHGKDVRGLIRVNEFYKWEQLILCEANHETSVKFHEELQKNAEEFIESMEIPYHTVLNCGADIGQGQVKKYDIEAWVPKEGLYREVTSASYFHDFQTRRLNIRYRDTEGTVRYAHSLNSTAIATPRVLVSLIENFQQEDGSIRIPKVLAEIMGKDVISKK